MKKYIFCCMFLLTITYSSYAMEYALISGNKNVTQITHLKDPVVATNLNITRYHEVPCGELPCICVTPSAPVQQNIQERDARPLNMNTPLMRHWQHMLINHRRQKSNQLIKAPSV